jgi:hypothetical protein
MVLELVVRASKCRISLCVLWTQCSIEHVMALFLGVLAKLWKATSTFVMSVCLSSRPSTWNNLAPPCWIFNEIWCLRIFRKSVQKIQVYFKFHENNRYFTWRQIYSFDHNLLSSSGNEKYSSQTQRKSKHTYFQ